METDFRRVFFAMVVAMAAFLGYRFLIETVWPTQKPTPAATQPAGTDAARPAPATPDTTPATQPPLTTPSTSPGAGEFYFTAAEHARRIQLGGREGDALRIELNARGAALESIELFSRDKKGQFVHSTAPHVDEPYRMLEPVDDGRREQLSFATYRIWIKELDNRSFTLADLPWEVTEDSPAKVVFSAAIRNSKTDDALLELTKTYWLHDQKPIFNLDLRISNVSSGPLDIWVEQDGPIGIPAEHHQYDMRRLLTVQHSAEGPHLNKAKQHSDLQKATRAGEPLRLTNPEQGPVLWTVLSNKYFGVYTRPLPVAGGDLQDYVADVHGLVAVPMATKNLGDLLARITTRIATLPPGGAADYPFEIYAGPKDAAYLRLANPEYANPQTLYYQVAQSADQRCCCTFAWLRDLMVWLLAAIHYGVRNYGIAIIILVIVIRTLLHPLTVFQQKSMFRMQETMARIQPKVQAIKEKFASDKQKQNQETMKLFGEEGVNPAGSFVSFLPMLLQMPILIALWTSLNTDINLRHAPFDGWWIDDLSAPDAFWSFTPPISIPILSQIPLVGGVFRDINSINLLPILMGVSMWLQQKYMPKPHMKAKLDAAKKQPAHGARSGMTPEDQLRQQQIMMYMMSILFPLMFYKMPSGLNLYWMSTNIFGIFESLIIRRQLDEEKKRRQRDGPQAPQQRKPGLLSRFFKHIAAQAEDLQRKADDMSNKDEYKQSDTRRRKGK